MMATMNRPGMGLSQMPVNDCSTIIPCAELSGLLGNMR